jgi:hypothetical protein
VRVNCDLALANARLAAALAAALANHHQSAEALEGA